MDYTKSELWAYYILVTFAILAILFTILIFVFSKISPVRHSFIFVFMVNLLCVSATHSLSFALNWKVDNMLLLPDFFCRCQSVLMIMSCQSQEIWVMFITIICYQGVAKLKFYNCFKNIHLIVISMIIGYALTPYIIIIILAITNNLGQVDKYCWLNKGNTAYNTWSITLYGVKFSYIFVDLILSIVILYIMRRKRKDNTIDKLMIKFCYKTLGFPLIEIICNVTSVALRYSDITSWSTIISSLQGVAYPLYIGWYAEIFQSYCFKKTKREMPSIIQNMPTIEVNTINDGINGTENEKDALDSSLDYYD